MKYSSFSKETIDFLTEKHVQGVVASSELMLILVMSSYTWWEGGKQNPCMKSSGALAKIVGRSEVHTKRALTRLKEAGIIRFIYRTQVGKVIRTTTNKRIAEKRQRREKTLPTYYKFNITNMMVNSKHKKK